MASYLVTGAAGFIGSALVGELVQRGEKVRAIDNFATGKRENLQFLRDKIELMEIDITNQASLGAALAGMDYVLHQAALPSVAFSIAEPWKSHDVNVNGTFNLLLAARDAKVKRVVFAASSAAYGDTLHQPKHEQMLPEPVTPYAVQKLTGEHYMRSFANIYGLETVCLRYFNVFGPRQDPMSPYSGVLSRFITKMLCGEAPTIFGDGEQSRDFVYVDNVVTANLNAATIDDRDVVGHVFNIGSGDNTSLNLIFRMLCDIIGFDGRVLYGPPRPGDVRHSRADITFARDRLGYSTTVGLEDGLRRTVDWYRTSRPEEVHER